MSFKQLRELFSALRGYVMGIKVPCFPFLSRHGWDLESCIVLS